MDEDELNEYINEQKLTFIYYVWVIVTDLWKDG